MTVRIDQAPPSPLSDAVKSLTDEAGAEGFDWVGGLHTAWTQRPFDRPGEGLFLAWTGDRLVGCAAITEDHHLRDGKTGRLRFIYVSPKARGQGIANALIARCLVQASNRWKSIRLHTINPGAARLYIRFGFVELEDTQLRATHVLTGLP